MLILIWLLTVVSVILTVMIGLFYRENYKLRQYRSKAQMCFKLIEREQNETEAYRQNQLDKRQKAEEKLRRYLKFMDTLINTIPNPIYYKDENGIFRGCNKSFAERILGISRGRIIGHRAEDLNDQIPPNLAAFYRKHELKMLQNGGVRTFEAKVQCADSITREFIFSIAKVNNEDGQTIGSVGVMLDLTEKNRATRYRIQKEKLQGVLETAGAVCHEMNQPLQALYGRAELIMADIDSDDKAYIAIDKIREQANRMVTITRKLQGITRYETMDYADGSKIIDIHKSSTLN
jgi:PAS domain S-box-containing protein